jgi:hypothetical protein
VSGLIKLWINNNEKRLLKLINACVSHEMRNPLNSIFQMILKFKDDIDKIVVMAGGISCQFTQSQIMLIVGEMQTNLTN